MSCSNRSCEGVEAEIVFSFFAQLMNLFSVSLYAVFWYLNTCYLCSSVGFFFQLKFSLSPCLLMFLGWMNVVNSVNSSGMGWYEKCHLRWEICLLEINGRRKCTAYSGGSTWCEVCAWLPNILWNSSFFSQTSRDLVFVCREMPGHRRHEMEEGTLKELIPKRHIDLTWAAVVTQNISLPM